MQYEVENKFPIAAVSEWEERLAALGARFENVVEQTDVYFAHPVRDFSVTDEALRIRRIGETNLITYKGPKIDRETKTRRELELPLAAGGQQVPRYVELLVALGFREVAEVRKRRRSGQLEWGPWLVQLAFDEVDRLGHFIELEIVARQDQLEAVQASLLELARQLQLPAPERRSYLEMVLAAD